MDCFQIEGPVALSGSVSIAGSKNAALPILAASLLAEQPAELHRIPRLGDVRVMLRVLGCLGSEILPLLPDRPGKKRTGRALALSVPDAGPVAVPERLARAMRASFCVLGPLLARRGRAVVPLPGGCRIGQRPIDLHLAGLAALGADLSVQGDQVVGRAGRLRGATINQTGPRGSTVTRTAKIISAPTPARGKTVILGAAREPEIDDLGRFLQSLGARIEGLGTDVIEIVGVDSLAGTRHTIVADRIEAATLLLAGAITGRWARSADNSLRVTDVVPEDLAPVLAALEAVGFDIAQGDDWVAIRSAGRPLPADLVPQRRILGCRPTCRPSSRRCWLWPAAAVRCATMFFPSGFAMRPNCGDSAPASRFRPAPLRSMAAARCVPRQWLPRTCGPARPSSWPRSPPAVAQPSGELITWTAATNRSTCEAALAFGAQDRTRDARYRQSFALLAAPSQRVKTSLPARRPVGRVQSSEAKTHQFRCD